MHSFWNAPICCRLGLRPQTSLGILQSFHRTLKLHMIGIKIWSTVADPGVIATSNGELFFPRSIPITDWQYDEWNWLKKLKLVLQQLHRFGLWGTLSPDLLSSFSILQNCYFLNFKYGFYANVGESMLLNHVLNEVVYLRCLLQIHAPTFFKSWLYQTK